MTERTPNDAMSDLNNDLVTVLESKSNKVTSLSSSSSNIEYPSAKAVVDYVEDAIGVIVDDILGLGDDNE